MTAWLDILGNFRTHVLKTPGHVTGVYVTQSPLEESPLSRQT
jgi:hypothetical protein